MNSAPRATRIARWGVSRPAHPPTCSPFLQGELVFVTSRTCRDVGPAEAESCILGYTVGNDFSCRLWQLSDRAGGQFYFANAFDKFAPIGPVLVNPERAALNKGVRLTTRVNGVAVQTMENCKTDWIWSPAQILSWMSRGESRVPITPR